MTVPPRSAPPTVVEAAGILTHLPDRLDQSADY
jgi:hypothetical protein